jgi:hypothetical protein
MASQKGKCDLGWTLVLGRDAVPLKHQVSATFPDTHHHFLKNGQLIGVLKIWIQLL